MISNFKVFPYVNISQKFRSKKKTTSVLSWGTYWKNCGGVFCIKKINYEISVKTEKYYSSTTIFSNTLPCTRFYT